MKPRRRPLRPRPRLVVVAVLQLRHRHLLRLPTKNPNVLFTKMGDSLPLHRRRLTLQTKIPHNDKKTFKGNQQLQQSLKDATKLKMIMVKGNT